MYQRLHGKALNLIDELVSKNSDISTSEISDTGESLLANNSEEDLDFSEDD